jgi:hypothetical protein
MKQNYLSVMLVASVMQVANTLENGLGLVP